MMRIRQLAVLLGVGALGVAIGVVLTQPRSSANVVLNALGTSGGSSGGGTQTPPTAPGIPGANVTSESAATSLTWTWGIATDCSGCAGILAYYLDVGTSAGGSDVVNDAVISGGATSYTHDTLTGQRATYYATVYAKSAGGTNSVTSQSITNPTIDRAGPTFTSLAAGSIGQSSATVTWSTNEAATSQVRYGTSSGSYGSSTSESSSRNSNHSVDLTGLTAGTTYYLQARGSDQYGNAGSSSETSFTTSAAAASSSTSSSPSSSSSASSSATPSTSSGSSASSDSGSGSASSGSSSNQTAGQSTESSSQSSESSKQASGSSSSSSKKGASTASSTSQSTTGTTSSAPIPTAAAPLVIDLTTPPVTPPVLTVDQGLILKGTAEPNEAITVYVYSDPKQYHTTADDAGTWSIEVPPSELTEGAHRVELETASQPKTAVLAFSVGAAAPTAEAAAEAVPTPQELIDETDRMQAWLLVLLAATGLLVAVWFLVHRIHAHSTQPHAEH